MNNVTFFFGRLGVCALVASFISASHAQPARILPEKTAGAIVVEAEDFRPATVGRDAWKVVLNGEGNYMVDTIGYGHISGERLLCASAKSNGARALASVTIPAAGDYKMWARFEQPVNSENRFRVAVRQNGKTIGEAVLGEASATKYFFGILPVREAGAPWGWEGLVEQGFSIKGLGAGAAEIELTSLDQPQPAASRNVDFLFLTPDLEDKWRTAYPRNPRYPILDAALDALPTRYYLRVSSPLAQTVAVRWKWNRIPWNDNETLLKLAANTASAWIPLRKQDVSHFSTLVLQGAAKGLNLRVELASDADGRRILRTLDWRDEQSNQLLISLPPYPGKYRGEEIQTADEQYRAVAAYLKNHLPVGGREPKVALNWAGYIPVWQRGRLGDAAAEVYHAVGMRGFLQFIQAKQINPTPAQAAEIARERFAKWGETPNRGVALGAFRQFPTPENIARAKAAAESANVLPLVQRFDYGDEISFSEWLKPFSEDELKTRFAAWKKAHGSTVDSALPDSRGAHAEEDAQLFVDSMRFYEDTAIETTAAQARAIPAALGPDVLYGANYLAHPYYYPRIAPYIKWFRATPSGDYAANFGRHSQYFWQVHQPGAMVDGYLAEHFRAGMRDNPKAQNIQYTMPHAPGNTDESFLRSSFTHLAHGARGLDFFGIGLNSSDTENYIDVRFPSRYGAIRQVNRAMATVEDILPQSRVVPGKIALILSDSTERWDLAAVTGDRAGSSIEGIAGIAANNPRVRLTYHQDRLGIYYALVNNGRPPDLLTEDDVLRGRLKDYQVAYWVGDCSPNAVVDALAKWVRGGGNLVATAGAFRFDEYYRPLKSGHELLGISTSELTEATRFVRPLIELPNLRPLDDAAEMPALAVLDKITVAEGAQVLTRFASGTPATMRRPLAKGSVTYIATLPGLAYLWSAYQPAPIASHGPESHVVPQNFNAQAERVLLAPALGVLPQIDAGGARIDARLLSSPQGMAIPLANYQADTTREINFTLRDIKVSKISSARRGVLKFTRDKSGAIIFRYAPGIGDILRLER